MLDDEDQVDVAELEVLELEVVDWPMLLLVVVSYCGGATEEDALEDVLEAPGYTGGVPESLTASLSPPG